MAADKLVDSTQLGADLTSVANAIRTKGGTSAALAFPADFVSAIQAIPSGGGGSLKYEIGTFTLESDVVTGGPYAIPHEFGQVPDVVIIFPSPSSTNGSDRGYFYFKEMMGETTQYLSSAGTSDYPAFAHYYVSDVGPPLKSRVFVPSSNSYVFSSNSLPTATHFYLIKSTSSSTWHAGTYNYFLAEKWW